MGRSVVGQSAIHGLAMVVGGAGDALCDQQWLGMDYSVGDETQCWHLCDGPRCWRWAMRLATGHGAGYGPRRRRWVMVSVMGHGVSHEQPW